MLGGRPPLAIFFLILDSCLFFGAWACDTCDTGEGPYDQKHSFDACFCLSGPSLKSKAGLPPGRG